MTERTHDQKLQKAAEMLTAKPARLIQMILVKAMIGVVDGSVEAVKEAEAKIDALEAENARLRTALSAMLTHMGMDEDEWNKPTFDQARKALETT